MGGSSYVCLSTSAATRILYLWREDGEGWEGKAFPQAESHIFQRSVLKYNGSTRKQLQS